MTSKCWPSQLSPTMAAAAWERAGKQKGWRANGMPRMVCGPLGNVQAAGERRTVQQWQQQLQPGDTMLHSLLRGTIKAHYQQSLCSPVLPLTSYHLPAAKVWWSSST